METSRERYESPHRADKSLNELSKSRTKSTLLDSHEIIENKYLLDDYSLRASCGRLRDTLLAASRFDALGEGKTIYACKGDRKSEE